MSIIYDAEQQIFHLQTTNTSYVFGLARGSYPVHLHWGRKIRGSALSDLDVPVPLRLRRPVEHNVPAVAV
ncbi:hypothetical protein AMQ83_06620 [Paenibacillus riograndensis]|nr:hypothetical protein AMQ83_06620 [Paenibacillus riograndensis]